MGNDEPPGKLSLGKTKMIEAQQGELNRIFNEFDEVVTKKLGQTIDTGQSPPVKCYPYIGLPYSKKRTLWEGRKGYHILLVNFFNLWRTVNKM